MNQFTTRLGGSCNLYLLPPFFRLFTFAGQLSLSDALRINVGKRTDPQRGRPATSLVP